MAGQGFETGCRTCGQPLPVRYLGLGFDWRARLVSRAGSQQGARRLPHSLMMILEALAADHGEAVSEAVLLAAYRAGGAACPRLISKKVSDLRRAIAPLGLGIEIARTRGYRLIDTTAEAEAA